MAEMIGVDIGASAVRVVAVAGVDSRGMAIVTKLGIAEVAPGAIVAGKIRSPEEVSVAMVHAFKEARIRRRYGFILGIESPDIALSNITLPASLKKFERNIAIRTMNKPISPTFSIGDSALSTSLFESVELNKVIMNTVSVAAALQSEVNMLKSVCALAKATPKAIDLTGAALLRSYIRANPEANEIGTVVSIGASRTTIATREGMYLRSIRTVAGAGSEITRAIMSVTGEPFEIAEEEKVKNAVSKGATKLTSSYAMDESFSMDGSSPVDRAINNSVDLLVDSIAQAIDSDSNIYGNISQGVTLVGGTALMRGLKEKLSQRIGIPVSIGKPWAEIERSRAHAHLFANGGKVDPRLLLAIGPAVGLALWKDPS